MAPIVAHFRQSCNTLELDFVLGLTPPAVLSAVTYPGAGGRPHCPIHHRNASHRRLLLSLHPRLFIAALPRSSVRHAKDVEAVAQAAWLTQVCLRKQDLFSREYCGGRDRMGWKENDQGPAKIAGPWAPNWSSALGDCVSSQTAMPPLVLLRSVHSPVGAHLIDLGQRFSRNSVVRAFQSFHSWTTPF